MESGIIIYLRTYKAWNYIQMYQLQFGVGRELKGNPIMLNVEVSRWI